MFDSRCSLRDEVASKSAGDVLTVVDPMIRSRLDAAVGAIAHPVHLDSLFAATARRQCTTGSCCVLLGPATISGDISPDIATSLLVHVPEAHSSPW